MKLFERCVRVVLWGAVIALPLTGCGSGDDNNPQAAGQGKHDVYFNGYVYDGADGSRLQGYTLEVQYRDAIMPGTVAPDGRYQLGPIPVFQDYTISITANGYR